MVVQGGPGSRKLFPATVGRKRYGYGLFSAALFQSLQYVASLVHGTPILVDFAVFEGNWSITHDTTENSTDQGSHHAIQGNDEQGEVGSTGYSISQQPL